MRAVFIDTNILIFATSFTSPLNAEARKALTILRDSGAELYISSQVLREYTCNMTAHSLAPRPAIARNIARFRQMTVLYDNEIIFDRWLDMIKTYRVSGKAIYDCNIAATMLQNGITEILTHNVKDFKRYSNVLSVIPFIPSVLPTIHTP